jgi:antitoxin (DNA-binding transcriptional repressor) of toxin-antitoxin stability system
MKTATVRELRHAFPKVIRWVEDGESVELKRRGKVIAIMRPPKPAKSRRLQWPDFKARLRDIYGDKVLTPEASTQLREDLRGDR